jgi:peptidoglycan/xylan/chitin deacetylase (PgdA/CDA1 family)
MWVSYSLVSSWLGRRYIISHALQDFDRQQSAPRATVKAASLYYAGLRVLGLPAATRQLRNAAVVLSYHNVVSEEVAVMVGTGLHITQARFRDQMRWLAAHYTVIPLRELVARMRAGRPLRRMAAISFDDAYRGVFDYASPVLEEFHLPATVFVVTDAPAAGESFWWDHPLAARQAGGPSSRRWLGDLRGDGRLILQDLGVAAPLGVPPVTRPADWDVIRASVRAGLDLGVHSATHRALPRLSDDELQAEMVDSRETLARHTGVTAEFFAYPYGLWDQRVRSAAQAAGYAMALALKPRLVSPRADPWALPRVNIPARITDSAFQAWITGWSPHRTPRG